VGRHFGSREATYSLDAVLKMQAICVDSEDPQKLARFWQEALGWRLTVDNDGDVVLEPPAGSPHDGVAADLLFLTVPEGKATKNRLHLDLRPDDQVGEVARLEGLGARRVSVGQGDDVSWVVLADPEGNEFCVLRAYRPDELAEIAVEEAAKDAARRTGTA
jgi:catechol 2,3-dioxygenase-like lactoylglutathione lyase family enzyme